MAGYYCRFVEGFSKIARPLTRLTEKNLKFKLTHECEKTFQELKDKLESTHILTISLRTGGFVIYSDALRKGLGCVLKHNGKMIAYGSK